MDIQFGCNSVCVYVSMFMFLNYVNDVSLSMFMYLMFWKIFC